MARTEIAQHLGEQGQVLGWPLRAGRAQRLAPEVLVDVLRAVHGRAGVNDVLDVPSPLPYWVLRKLLP